MGRAEERKAATHWKQTTRMTSTEKSNYHEVTCSQALLEYVQACYEPY